MKKIKSKLFKQFELSANESSMLMGGSDTSRGSDTNLSEGNYDIIFDTLNGSGESTGNDVKESSNRGSASDKPNCERIASNSFMVY